MKRTIAIILSALLLVSAASASDQKTYTTSSPEYRMAYALCVSGGVLPPSSVSPMTGAEIAKALSFIPESRLSDSEEALRQRLLEKLDWKPIVETTNFGVDPRVVIAPEIYLQSSKDVSRHQDYLIGYKDRLPFLDFALDFDFAGIGYGFAEYLFLSPGIERQYDKIWGTNIDAILKGFNTQHEGTLRAGILFGNDWMNFSIQAARQSMGYGRTGNLALGDNFTRQHFMRLHTFSRFFDYTLNITQYNTMQDTTSSAPDSLSVNSMSFSGAQQIYPVHRLEAKIADKVQIVAMAGSMTYADNILDIRLLNPFLMLHGFNNYGDETKISSGDEGNNLFAVELGYTFVPHFRLNLQFLSDQITLSGEIREEENTCPNAFGFLLNLESSWILDDRYLTVWLEGAYTMPYTYLNRKQNGTGSWNHNYDYIVGYDLWGLGEIGYATYRYGSDAIVMGLGAMFGDLDRFSVEGSLTYIIHGKYGLGYESVIAEHTPASLDDTTPTTGLKNAEHRIEATLDGSYEFLEGLCLEAGIGLVQIWNYRLDPGKTFTDLQLKVGLSFDPVTMFT